MAALTAHAPTQELPRLLGRLRACGVEIVLYGSDIAIEGPAHLVGNDLLAELRAVKQGVIAYLQPRACADCAERCGSSLRCSECAASRVPLVGGAARPAAPNGLALSSYAGALRESGRR